MKSSVVCIFYRVCSEGCHFKVYICTLHNNTDTHQQIPRMRSTDWLSHHRLAIYRYEFLGTNVISGSQHRTIVDLILIFIIFAQIQFSQQSCYSKRDLLKVSLDDGKQQKTDLYIVYFV